jgi:hypothetical protein
MIDALNRVSTGDSGTDGNGSEDGELHARFGESIEGLLALEESWIPGCFFYTDVHPVFKLFPPLGTRRGATAAYTL